MREMFREQISGTMISNRKLLILYCFVMDSGVDRAAEEVQMQT